MRLYILTLLAVGATCQIIPGQGNLMRSLVSNLKSVPVLGKFQDSYKSLVSNLKSVPVLGKFLGASVDPLYKPLLNPFQYIGLKSRIGEDNEQCFGEIGCLKTPSEFFHPLTRPINLPAYTRDQINTTYKVHTRQIPQGTIVPALELQQRFNRSSFYPTKDTKIIIHGYLGTYGATWMVSMVRAFLKYGDINVITVDWSGGSHNLYTQAVTNIRVVGLEVAHLVNWMHKTYRIDPVNVHLIGHSLGAHISGYAGERIPGLGRITGLDPAEPYFQNMDPIVRLDPSDANFVDVIHTDAASDSILQSVLSLGYGMEQSVGHIDFYPNGGKNQAGCKSITRRPFTVFAAGMEEIDLFEGLDAAQKELIICNHIRAPKLFTDSILSLCPYTAFQCDSFEDYTEGLCSMDCGVNNTNCAPMGLHADKWQDRERKNVKMFLSTIEGPTYCTYHYRLDLTFSDPENRGDTLRGRLKISFILEDGQLKDFDLTPNSPVDIKQGSSISFTLTHPEDLTGSRQALISWIYEPDMFSPLSYCVPLFCSSDLQITALALTSFDSRAERTWNPVARTGKTEEIIMCHTLGDRVINIPSGKIMNVAASTSCPDILTEINQKFKFDVASTPSENDITWVVERIWPKHLEPWRPWKTVETWGTDMKKQVVSTVKEWVPFSYSFISYGGSNSRKPAYDYMLNLTFSDHRSKGNSHVRGTFKLSFIRPNGQLTIIDLTEASARYFPRKGSIAFSITNKYSMAMEDLTQSKDVLVTWESKTNTLNPLSWCALNCKTELYLKELTLTSYDSRIEREKHVSKRSDATASVTMCGAGHEKMSTLTSFQSLILNASENCTQNDQSKFDEFIDHTYSFMNILDTAKKIMKYKENTNEGDIKTKDSIDNEDSNEEHIYDENSSGLINPPLYDVVVNPAPLLVADSHRTIQNCKVSEWTRWSRCDVSCGMGKLERSRQILIQPENGGRRCPKKLRSKKSCTRRPCSK